MAMLTDPDALPQLIGEYRPVDQWQAHINKLFYGLRGGQLRDYSQTFASADYRLAHALAADYYTRAKARDKTLGVRRPSRASGSSDHASGGKQDAPGVSPHPLPLTPYGSLIVHEWGCGNGNLAACFLSHLKSLDKDGTVYPRVRYVMVENYREALDLAKAHPDLTDHLDRVDTLCADVTELGAVPDGTVDRILCNELWNDLPTKLMLKKDGEIEEEFFRPNLKEHRYAAITDWSGFVRAFDAGEVEVLRNFQPFLDDIIWETEYRKIEWKDVPFRKIITDSLRQIEEQVLVPVNVGAGLTIKEARRVLASDSQGFSSFDAGTADVKVLNDPDKPCYGQFGGQYSFMVNFLLLEAVAKYVGIPSVGTEPQKEFVGRSLGVNVASLVDLLSTHPVAGSMAPWEQDRLIINTIRALNGTYQSPYNRKIEFPIQKDMPAGEQEAMQELLLSLKPNGVPDTIAYITEDEILAAGRDLEELGYDRQTIPAALVLPPQGVDYTHLFLGLS